VCRLLQRGELRRQWGVGPCRKEWGERKRTLQRLQSGEGWKAGLPKEWGAGLQGLGVRPRSA